MLKCYWKQFYKDFIQIAKKEFDITLTKTPNIGDSAFKFNFSYSPCYIAWYKSLKKLNLNHSEISKWILLINERPLQLIPPFILKSVGKHLYLGAFRKNAKKQEDLSKKNLLHEYDYNIQYKDIDNASFSICFYSCGMMKLCANFDALELFPTVCEVDFLLAHYMGCGFWRSKTLGSGSNCCDCHYSFRDNCECPKE